MDKAAFDIRTPARAYHTAVGQYPLVEAGLLGTGGAALGYHGADFAVKKFVDMMYSNKSPQERAAIMSKLRAEGIGDIKAVMGLLGGGLGAGYSLYKNMDRNRGIGGAAKSILMPNYWDRDPEHLKDIAAKARESARKAPVDASKLTSQYSSGRLQKRGSLDDPFLAPFAKKQVPLTYAKSVVEEDPFLTMGHKRGLGYVMDNSDDDGSGLVSGKDLMMGALRTGIGMGTGYLFGQTAGKLFSLPQQATTRLSRVGAVAGAIANTGILKELTP